MNFYDICYEKAEQGLNELLEYLRSDRNLSYTQEEKDDITCVEVEVFDEDMCTDFLGRFEFDSEDKLINYN